MEIVGIFMSVPIEWRLGGRMEIVGIFMSVPIEWRLHGRMEIVGIFITVDRVEVWWEDGDGWDIYVCT